MTNMDVWESIRSVGADLKERGSEIAPVIVFSPIFDDVPKGNIHLIRV